MLALYRCGRQAEGLEVYRQTRTLLNDELGLEPGVELQELERAILVQDPALNAGRRQPRARRVGALRDVCPFKGLAPFEAADAEFFFGRERLVDELAARLATRRCSRSSARRGAASRRSSAPASCRRSTGNDVLVRPGERPPADAGSPRARARRQASGSSSRSTSSRSCSRRAVTEDERRAFVDALVDAAWDPERRALILIALRADFFGHLAPYVELADLVGPNHVLLGPMSASASCAGRSRGRPSGRGSRSSRRSSTRSSTTSPARPAGCRSSRRRCSTSGANATDGALTLAAYERTGGVRGAVGAPRGGGVPVARPTTSSKVARRILLRLVARRRRRGAHAPARRRATSSTPTTTSASRACSRRSSSGGCSSPTTEPSSSCTRRCSSTGRGSPAGSRRTRTAAACTGTSTQAASEWEAAGRDPSELYRGARLAAALEWADAAGDDAGLNRLEREFLEESRTAFARAATGALRALLALALALLVAGARRGSGRARSPWRRRKHQATAAIAQRLGAQALVEPRLDRALLLAREGVDLDDSLATRSNLLAALLRSPAALAVLHGGGDACARRRAQPRRAHARRSAATTAASPSSTRGRCARSGRDSQAERPDQLLRRDRPPVRALAFSPDGRTLAVGDSDGTHADAVPRRRAHTSRARRSPRRRTTRSTADVAFAPDGRTLVTGEAVSGATSPPDRGARRCAAPPTARTLRRSTADRRAGA